MSVIVKGMKLEEVAKIMSVKKYKWIKDQALEPPTSRARGEGEQPVKEAKEEPEDKK